MARPSFVASAPYDASHPGALAVYCSDGRFTDAVEELLHSLGHPRLDTLTVPGGPGLFNVWTAGMTDSTSIASATKFLVDAHKLRRVLLIAHEGCGYYRQHFAGRAAPEVEKVQWEDLRLAARAIEGVRSGLRVDAYYARVAGDRVSFETVPR
jgi:hypothetical protein